MHVKRPTNCKGSVKRPAKRYEPYVEAKKKKATPSLGRLSAAILLLYCCYTAAILLL
jgi:hypothetical protein